MAWLKEVTVPKKMVQISSPTWFISRILGLQPFTVHKTNTNRYFLRWSAFYTAYSFLFAIVLVAFLIFGVANDMKHAPVRMTKGKSLYITCGDMSVVILTVLTGIFSMPIRLPRYFKLIEHIHEIDALLKTSATKSDASRHNKFLASTVTIWVAILGTDVCKWYQASLRKGNGAFLRNYAAFYALYCVVWMMGQSYANTIYCIKTYVSDFGGCLLPKALPEAHRGFLELKRHRRQQLDARNLGKFVDEIVKNTTIATQTQVVPVPADESAESVTVEDIRRLTKAHEKICEAVAEANRAYGYIILIIVLSCLLHLVITPYFLFLELLGDQSVLSLFLQTIWFFAHISRLLMIIEPCNSCIDELKNATNVICKVLNSETSEPMRKKLQTLITQLMLRPLEFSICGLVKIDRTLFTAIAGSVTTYVVILLQFNEDEVD